MDNKIKLPKYKTLKNGKIKARISVNGIFIYRTFENKDEMVKLLPTIVKNRFRIKNNGRGVKQVPLGVVWFKWLEHQKEMSFLKESTLKTKYHSLMLIHSLMETNFDEILINDIIEQWRRKEKLLKREIGRQVKDRLVILLQQLNDFSDELYNTKLLFDPRALRKLFKKPRKKSSYSTIQYHSNEQVKKVLSFLSTKQFSTYHHKSTNTLVRRTMFDKQEWLYAVYVISITTGLRVGELCSIKKENYDKENKTLLINSTITYSLSGKFVDGNSTKTSQDRLLKLSTITIKQIDFLLSNHSGLYIIPLFNNREKGSHSSGQNINRVMKRVFKACGVPVISSHRYARKTYVTLLFDKATNNDKRKKSFRDTAEALKNDIGHSDISTTMLYARPLIDNIDDDKEELFDDWVSDD